MMDHPDYQRDEVISLIKTPPPGCTLHVDGDGLTLRASMRSLKTGLVALGMAVFWNGIVSVFVSAALAGIYFNLLGPLPKDTPIPGLVNGVPIMNDEPMGWGSTIFLCVFLIPFVAIGIAILFATLMSFAGMIKIQLREDDCSVATGAFGIMRKRRFDPQQVSTIERRKTGARSRHNASEELYLRADKEITVGSELNDTSRQWLHTLLQQTLLSDPTTRQSYGLPSMNWLK